MNSASSLALSVSAAQPATHGEFGVYQMGEDQARLDQLGYVLAAARLTVSKELCWQRCEVQRQRLRQQRTAGVLIVTESCRPSMSHTASSGGSARLTG